MADRAAVVIDEVEDATEELLAALNALIPQLSSSAAALTMDALATLVDAQSSIVLVARNADGQLVGTLTLVVFTTPTGVRAWIEDVVVDERARGLGAGEALVNHALARARALGCRTVDLTSRASRESANRLYQRVGFAQRETNVYRFDLQ